MMAAWDQVEFGFSDDETCNFGPRIESGSALFQVNTTAVISTIDKVTASPHVCAATSVSYLCMVADNHVIFFTEEGATNSGVLAFESPVDVLAWCSEEILVVGERNGTIHFINGAEPALLFSQVFVAETDPSCPTFMSISFSTVNELQTGELLLLTKERLVVLSNIQLADYQNGAECDIQTIQKEIKLSIVDVGDEHTDGTTSAQHVGNHTNDVITTGGGKSVLTVWTPDDGSFKPTRCLKTPFYETILKVRILENGRFLLILDEKGHLALLHTAMLTIVKVWDLHQFSDFIFLDVSDNTSNAKWCDAKLALLTYPDIEGGVHSLEICTLRTLTAEYTLHVSEATHLVHGLQQQEDVFFIEGIKEDKIGAKSTFVTSLHLRCVAEVQPETRFNRMLSKKQFEKAEILANDFNLDIELVYKVKATGLLDSLSPWNIKKISSDEADNILASLYTCLNRIKVTSVIVDCCVMATPPHIEQVEELLLYARGRLNGTNAGDTSPTPNGNHHSGHNKQEDAVIEEQDLGSQALHINKILETFNRLATFHMAFGPDSYTPCRWAEFQGGNLLTEMYQQVKAANLAAAFTIWRRHLSEFEDKITVPVIDDLLGIIPEAVLSSTLRPFLLHDLLPFIVRKLRGALPLVAAWLQQKALNMEILEPESWPKNGLLMLRVLEDATVLTLGDAGPYNGPMDGGEGPLAQLPLLVREVEDLLHLSEAYGIRLSLVEYRKQTTESLVYRMLDQVPVVNLIPTVIRTVAIPYMRERKFKEEKVLLQYVVDIAERQGWSHHAPQGAASWEEKAIAVIHCITEPEYAVKAVLAVVHQATVPWSGMVESLVAETLEGEPHPLLEELHKKRRLVQLHKVVFKYNPRSSCVPNERTTWLLMRYIIKQDRATALQDALAVVGNSESILNNATSVYKEQLDFYINNNRMSECIMLVRGLTAVAAVKLGKLLLICTIGELDRKFTFDKQQSEQHAVRVTHITCDILRYLLTLDSEQLDCEDDEWFYESLGTLERIHALQVEFGEFLSHMDCTRSKATDTLWTLLRCKFVACYKKTTFKIPQSALCAECNFKKSSHDGTWTLNKVYRFSDLLGLPRSEVEGEVMLHACKYGQIQYAITFARLLHHQKPGPKTAALLYKLARQLLNVQTESNFMDKCAKVSNLPEVVSELADIAVTFCDPDLLMDCLELANRCRLAASVANQCEGDCASVLKVSRMHEDPYENWTFNAHYKEEGLVLESTDAMPLANQYALSCLPDSGSMNRLPYIHCGLGGSILIAEEVVLMTIIKELSAKMVGMVKLLKQNNQLLLALSYSMDTLFVIAQHISMIKVSSSEGIAFVKDFLTKATIQLNQLKAELAQKLFKQLMCDSDLALGILLSMPPNMASKLMLKTIHALCNTRNKLTANLAAVGVDFAVYTSDLPLKNIFTSVQQKSIWAHRLNKLGLNKEAKSLNFAQGPKMVLSQIVQQEAITIPLLQRFTSTFTLYENDALVDYLYYQLLPPLKPGASRPALKHAQAMCAIEAIGEVSDQKKLLSKLIDILKEVDPYDYERLEFIFNQILLLDFSPVYKQKSELLRHLMLYERIAPPGDYECSLLNRDPGIASVTLSPLSKTRIPFHALSSGQGWKIISPELNASTVEVWVPIAKLLDVKVDQLYLVTIQNMIKQYIDHMKAMRGGDIMTDYQFDTTDAVTDMMAVIRRLLLSVSSYKQAMACATWAFKQLPQGSLKLAALRACLMLSEQFLQSLSSDTESDEYRKAKDVNTMLDDTYHYLSTEQTLYEHALAQPELLAMSGQPAALVKALYHHSSIQERTGHLSKLSALPDIHAASIAICKVHNLDINQLLLELIELWLPSTCNSQQNMSITLDADNLELSYGTEDETSEEEVNLKRLIYVFKFGPLEKGARFLICYIFKESRETPTICKIRALACLFSFADPDTIENESKLTVMALETHLQYLIYLHELELLNLDHTFSSFLKCNKEGLVRSILRRHRHQKQAVKLVANLCLDFNILDAALWNSILEQLHAFGMLGALRQVLVRLTELPQLWSISCMSTMWKEVIIIPLTEVSAPLEESQEYKVLETLALLHRCPCVWDPKLDLTDILRHFARLRFPLAALSCVLLLPHASDRKAHVDHLLKGQKLAVLRSQLDTWQEMGRQLPLHEQIKAALYSYIRRNELYGELTDMAHAAELAFMVVQEDDIQGLLVYLLTNNRMKEATQLLLLHAQHHPKHAAAVAEVTEPEERIQVFAQLYQMENAVLPLLLH